MGLLQAHIMSKSENAAVILDPRFLQCRQFKGIEIVSCVNMTTTSVRLLDKFDRNFEMLVYLKSENSSC